MSIFDHREQWLADFQAGWLKTYLDTGELDWKVYNLPKNETTVSGPAVDLSKSRLAVITTGGFYVAGKQEPMDEPDMHGRYDIRLLPADMPPEEFSIVHGHYDHTAANEDRQVLLPMRHLAEMVEAGEIGEIAPNIISFMGYQPDVTRVLDETIPAIVTAAQEMEVTAALLLPA
ncbi:MAG: glycine/betaine/sarcosine/D-proline reductase family selenoprotein B [Cellvibrionaceae bacterium]|jgi:glycine/betaine/sarcosine/D-proline reductase family selenoprotein B